MNTGLAATTLALLALTACAPAAVTPPSLDASSVDTSRSDASTVDARAADTATVDVTHIDTMDVPEVVETPMRLAQCTNQLGHALTRAYGRLDGHLVAIVPTGARGCNADPDHLHLQVAANGAVYDVAVNLGAAPMGGVLDLSVAADDLPLPDGAWSEGWHPSIAPLDYVTVLHLHSEDFTPLAPAAVAARLENELRDVDRIAVFATGYGPDGAHDVHRNAGMDGALALHPLGPSAHLLLFHFSSQTF